MCAQIEEIADETSWESSRKAEYTYVGRPTLA